MSVMNTFYGRTFDPMEMTEENVALEDIARAAGGVLSDAR